MNLDITFLRKHLLDFTKDLNTTPVLATFTTTLFSKTKSKILLKHQWRLFLSDMVTKLPNRLTHFPILGWAIEQSVDSCHIHVAMFDEFSARGIQKLWKKHFQYAGHVDVKAFDSFEQLIWYTFKSYDKVCSYLGHCVQTPAVPLSTI